MDCKREIVERFILKNFKSEIVTWSADFSNGKNILPIELKVDFISL
jgi:hypothetical protein